MSGNEVLLTVSLFGELRIRVNNLPIPRISGKAQELFALLVLWNEHPVSRKLLAATLWPESKQPNALGLLRSTLLELRKALGPAAVRLPTEDRTTLHLDLQGASVDAFEFDQAVKQGSPDALKTARALYRHELLQGWQASWVQPERERRVLAYAQLLQQTGAATNAPFTTVFPSISPPLEPQFSQPSRNPIDLAEIRSLLAANREQMQRAGSQLDRLERLLDTLTPDLVAQENLSRAESLYTLGVSRHLEGDFEGADNCLQQALQITQKAESPDLQARILTQLGRLIINRDRSVARIYFLKAYELRLQQHHAQLGYLISSLLGLGDVAADVEEEIRYYEKALHIAEVNEDESGKAWAHNSLASVPLHRTVWDPESLHEMLAHLDLALRGFITTQDMTGLFAVLEGLVGVCYKLGYIPGAARMLALEMKLREDNSLPRILNQSDEGTLACMARQNSSEIEIELAEDFDWKAAVKEARKLIQALPEIRRTQERRS